MCESIAYMTQDGLKLLHGLFRSLRNLNRMYEIGNKLHDKKNAEI